MSIYPSTRLLVCSRFFFISWLTTVEIVIPELHEMRIAHIVSIGPESLCTLNPDCGGGKGVILTYDTRTNLAFFHSFIAADYVATQRLRRRLMYFHMEIFEMVDIIVTPTTRNIPITISYTSFFISMTPPRIPPSAIKVRETDLQVSSFSLSHLLPDIINYGVN
ncbi:fatty acid amide hydrolase-like isoform X1 [Solanum tuberosum]|nr:PREDICTED: fatty acid amide hydrolase-like isoform X1 [Solanum tuberosum]